MITLAGVVAVVALLLGITLVFAVNDLMREVRSLNKRLQGIENAWLGNRETVYRVGEILPKLEEIVRDDKA